MKNCTISFLILFLTFLVSCKSGYTKIGSVHSNYIPYYQKIYEADSLFVIGNYGESYRVLDSLFTLYEPINTYRIREYETYCILSRIVNKKLKSKDFFSLVSKYGYDKNWIVGDSILNSYYNSIPNSEKLYKAGREKYVKSIDLELRAKIINMVAEDQKYRTGKSTPEILALRQIVDSTNEQEVRKIFNDVGYPNEAIIGNYTIDKSNVIIAPILYHTSTSTDNEYFFSKVLEYTRQGRVEPFVYAFMIDRYNLFRFDKQLYGTFTDRLILSESEVNNNRHTIGIPSLGYEDWKNKIVCPELQ